MGMLDQELILSDAQPVTTASTDTASTNIYNTGGANGQGDAGQTGENLWINVFANTATATDSSTTVQAVLQDSADGTSFANVVAGPALAVTSGTPVAAGTALLQVQPPVGMRQYWRIAYRVGAAALVNTSNGSKFDAYVSNTIERNITRKSGLPAIG